MPKYVVGCVDGHDRICFAPYEIFDGFKRATEQQQCRVKRVLLYGIEQCQNPIYIKPQTAQFTIQAGKGMNDA